MTNETLSRFWDMTPAQQHRQLKAMYEALWSIHAHAARELRESRETSVEYQTALMEMMAVAAEKALTPFDPPAWK